MFNILRREYESKYRIPLDQYAEDRLLDIKNRMQAFTSKVKPIQETSLDDMLTSLIFSRSCDIALTRKQILGRDFREAGSITADDVDYAVLSMPCKCPVQYKCCEQMASDNINYVVAFPQDMDMLKEYGVSKITDIPNIKRVNFEGLSAFFTMGLSKDDDYSIQTYMNLLRSKLEIWESTAEKIAIPLVEFYRTYHHMRF